MNEPQNLHQQASLKSRSRLCVGLFRKIKTPNYECRHPGDEERNAQGDNPVWPHGATPLNSFDNKKIDLGLIPSSSLLQRIPAVIAVA